MSNRTGNLRGRLRGGSGAAAALAMPLAACLLAACSTSSPTANSSTPGSSGGGTTSAAPSSSSGGGGGQAPVPVQVHPAGDIPDTTIYVPYTSAAGHVRVKVPEGWSRQSTATSTTFTSNLNTITLAWMPMSAAPTVSSVRATTVPALQKSTLAFRLQDVRAVTLAGGPAIETIYQVNSQPNAVTGRQYRLVIQQFEFYKNGRGATLSLSSAVGSDNVDPWRKVSESFTWV
jgi:hypothetical protein